MELLSISPIDGRYTRHTSELRYYFSEYSFIKYRLFIEIEYLITLGLYELYSIELETIPFLRDIHDTFDIDECKIVKEIENTTKHDVKSIEYYIRDKIIDTYGRNASILNFIHFGLTSQDINSSANILMIKESLEEVLIPKMNDILHCMKSLSNKWKSIPLLARTHGQPATPTTLGKEIGVFHERLYKQMTILKSIKYTTKFGGATGNFNAHHYAKPDLDWDAFADNFIKLFNLKRNKPTTQIDHYDNYSEIFDALKRINVICIDLCQDMWLYISRNIIIHKIVTGEVGSSTMPFKINPINFENAEGNFLLSNSMLEFFSRKLPISRLQRDLTDSTILRNVGSSFSYMLIGLSSLYEGLNKIEVNEGAIYKELTENFVVVTEGLQTRLKILGIKESYETMKELSRDYYDAESIKTKLTEFINGLDIDDNEKAYLKSITPFNYIGK